MAYRLFLPTVVLIATGATTLAEAQPHAGPSSSLTDVIHVGDHVIVTDTAGHERRGLVRSLTETSLTVGGRLLPVEAVDTIRQTDPLANGTWTGAAISTGGTLVALARCGRFEFSEQRGLCTAGTVTMGLFAVPLSAFIGRQIDRARGDQEVYRRPSRVTTGVRLGWTLRGPAVAASLSW